MYKKLLLSITIFLAGGVCGFLLQIQTAPNVSDTFFDFWMEQTLTDAVVETTYDEKTNTVYVGDNITVHFNLESNELEGIGMSYDPLDSFTLTSTQFERMDYHRNQLVLTEIKKLFGSDSEHFQNVVAALEDSQES